VKFTNGEKLPIVPMGAELRLSGLILPKKRGIMMDMKRIDQI